MTSTETHKKHADLKRPDLGQFGRHELALIGAPCGLIQEIAAQMIDHLKGRWKVSYVDADHAGHDEKVDKPFSGSSEWIDKIGYRQLNISGEPNAFHRRAFFNDQDMVLINGNHFSGKEQVVFIHPKKEESLSRKLDRLTDVRLVIKTDDTPVYDFLKPHLKSDVEILDLEEKEALHSWFAAWAESTTPSLSGLVLAGGKSQRMGYDKTVIDYHGKPQREHLASVLRPHCEKVYISCREDQKEDIDSKFPLIVDQFTGLGPYGGILSAFKENPNNAWIVLASDLPFAAREAVESLLENRDTSKVATAFHNSTTGFPDPLITIWEPRAYPVLLQFLAQGYSCPRKALINSEIAEIKPENESWLMNVNTPEDVERAKKLMDN